MHFKSNQISFNTAKLWNFEILETSNKYRGYRYKTEFKINLEIFRWTSLRMNSNLTVSLCRYLVQSPKRSFELSVQGADPSFTLY